MRLVVIGGSDAGISAALRARECDPSSEVTMLLADRYPNFSICGLPFFLSGEISDWRTLAHRTEDDIRRRGIAIKADHVVERVDALSRTVEVRAPDGLQTFAYDRLVIGTGASPIRPPISGIDAENVYVLHTMDDSFLLNERLEHASTAVIIGGGYIGVEMADALRHRGMAVTLVERLPSILTTVDPEIGDAVRDELARHGVGVVTGVAVEAIEAAAGGVRVRSADLHWDADFALVVVGVAPNADLASAAGAERGERGAIRVDRAMRTTLPHVFAAGDCVETWHRLLERNTYLPLGTTSHKQGRVAGENAIGGAAQFEGVLGSQAVKIFDRVVASTGLTTQRASEAGFRVHAVDATFDDHKAYYPGASALRVRVVGERGTGRLLGAQMMGRWGSEVAKRFDVFAAALHHRMTIDQISDFDLTYTPPLSSPWDPVQMAAQAWIASLPSAVTA